MRTLSPYPGQTFDQLPSNATVAEGGSAEFSCTVLSNDPNPTRIDSVWAVQAPGGTEQFLGLNDVSMIDLNNGSTASVGTNFNSPLTIANVIRSIDGTRVRCFLLRNGIPTSQDEPYAFLSVQCKLLGTVPNVACVSNTTIITYAVIWNSQLACQQFGVYSGSSQLCVRCSLLCVCTYIYCSWTTNL